MVCGNDGRTYINLCYLMVENCQKGVELSHYGGCTNATQTAATEDCPSNCVTAERDGPVCGSDGNVYSNTCEMKRRTCGQSVVRADLRHCQTTKHCNDKCFRIRYSKYDAALLLEMILNVPANCLADLMENSTTTDVR